MTYSVNSIYSSCSKKETLKESHRLQGWIFYEDVTKICQTFDQKSFEFLSAQHFQVGRQYKILFYSMAPFSVLRYLMWTWFVNWISLSEIERLLSRKIWSRISSQFEKNSFEIFGNRIIPRHSSIRICDGVFKRNHPITIVKWTHVSMKSIFVKNIP